MRKEFEISHWELTICGIKQLFSIFFSCVSILILLCICLSLGSFCPYSATEQVSWTRIQCSSRWTSKYSCWYKIYCGFVFLLSAFSTNLHSHSHITGSFFRVHSAAFYILLILVTYLVTALPQTARCRSLLFLCTSIAYLIERFFSDFMIKYAILAITFRVLVVISLLVILMLSTVFYTNFPSANYKLLASISAQLAHIQNSMDNDAARRPVLTRPSTPISPSTPVFLSNHQSIRTVSPHLPSRPRTAPVRRSTF